MTPTTSSGNGSIDPREVYHQAVREFSSAVEMMQRGEFAGASAAFTKIGDELVQEPALTERCRTYARICDKRAQPAGTVASDAASRYYEAVMKANDGDCDAAISIFNDLIQSAPTSADYVYARAAAFALKGNAEAAIGDLRHSISLDPQTRFHAVNDPDFEQIREEPAFIDIIEPTPTGA